MGLLQGGLNLPHFYEYVCFIEFKISEEPKSLQKPSPTLNWNNNIYHTPFDDLRQKMNFNAALQHLHIIYEITKVMANNSKAPSWEPSTPFVNARLQSMAEKR